MVNCYFKKLVLFICYPLKVIKAFLLDTFCSIDRSYLNEGTVGKVRWKRVVLPSSSPGRLGSVPGKRRGEGGR